MRKHNKRSCSTWLVYLNLSSLTRVSKTMKPGAGGGGGGDKTLLLDERGYPRKIACNAEMFEILKN